MYICSGMRHRLQIRQLQITGYHRRKLDIVGFYLKWVDRRPNPKTTPLNLKGGVVGKAVLKTPIARSPEATCFLDWATNSERQDIKSPDLSF